MNTQLDIFTAPPPAQRHSATSVAAAHQAEAGAGTQRAIVLAWLKLHGPATDEAMQDSLGMNPNTQRPRRIELMRSGKVYQDGESVTKSGRKAAMWRAVV